MPGIDPQKYKMNLLTAVESLYKKLQQLSKKIGIILFFWEKLYGPFLWMGFNFLKAAEPLRGDISILPTKCPEISGTPFGRPWKDEKLSQPWSHPVVLNSEYLDWKPNALTTRPLLLLFLQMRQLIVQWKNKWF